MICEKRKYFLDSTRFVNEKVITMNIIKRILESTLRK